MYILQRIDQIHKKPEESQQSKYDIFKIQKKNEHCFCTALYDVTLTDSEARRVKSLKPGEVYWNTSNLYAIYSLHGTMTRKEALEKLKKVVEETTKKRIALVENELIRLQKYLDDLDKLN